MPTGVEGDVRLLGLPVSPFLLRVRFALGLKKVPYEFVEEDVFNKSELLLKSNPVYKKIPVLLHGERSICESMIIIEYMDDVWTGEGVPAIIPSDPHSKAMARFWATYIDNTWYPNLRRSALTKSRAEAAEAMEQVVIGLQLLEDVLRKGSKPFFSGETVGYLDIALGGFVPMMKATDRVAAVKLFDETRTPLLVAWAKRFLAQDGFKEVVPEPDKFIDFIKKLKEWTAAAAQRG